MNTQSFATNSHTHDLRAPHAWESICGAFVTLLKSRRTLAPLRIHKQIGNHELLTDFGKKDGSRNMTIGLYQHNGKKYVIKQWVGVYKDLSYYTLINEYVVNSILAKKDSFLSNRVRVPLPIEYIRDARSLACVFEYIEGDHLSNMTVDIQSQVTSQCLEALDQASAQLSDAEKNGLGRRTTWFYALVLVITPFASMCTSPRDAKDIFRACARALRNLMHLKHPKMTLSHRDLTPDNIMIYGETAYIMDTENLLMTFEGYDYAFIACSPEHKLLSNALPMKYNESTVQFLKQYIVIHNILGSGDFMRVNHEYLHQLQK